MKKNNPIYWQDEILQMMYWMRGEGLGEVVPLNDMNRLLNAEDEVLKDNIQRLVEKGYLNYASKRDDGLTRVLLTQCGIDEGKRRFIDEFEPYLGHEDHMVCDDPNCDCHDPAFDGVCTHLLHEQKGS